MAVSYTQLDVYKRQGIKTVECLERGVYMKKGIVFLIVFLMVISFPICGYAKGKEKIYLDSSWKYADYAKIKSGAAVLYRTTASETKNKVIAVNAGHGTKGGRCV